MSSEHLASAQNLLKGNLAGAWDILSGAQGQYDSLGIARRFGGASAAYSLRDIGALGGAVVRVRRDSNDDEEDFSAAQIASGALETFVQAGTDYSGVLSAVFSSNGTITNVSKEGFTADVAVFSHYVNATFTSSVSTGETVHVSFNAQLAPNGGTAATPTLRLQNAQVGANTSNQSSVREGFNSVSLTATGTSDRIGFLEQDDNVDYIISDFKVSSVSRNGFIETWYDQSANQRNAIQETATNQPSIVQNGNIVKVNSKPAITFDGNDNFLEVDGTGSAVAYSFSPSGDFGMFIVYKASVGNIVDSRDAGSDGIFLQQSSGTDTRFRYNGDGSINIVATNDAQHFNTMTLDGTTLSASVDGGTAGTDTVTAGVSTTQNLVLGAGFNQANATDGEIQEAIFYENSKASEKSEIETDINNFYSIT